MAGTWSFGNLNGWNKCLGLFFSKKKTQKEKKTKKKHCDLKKVNIFEQLPKSQIPLLAIHKIISHIWEDRSRKVNNDQPDFRFFHGNFWPVISQAVRKPCFSAWIPRGPNFWKPLTCGYVAAGAFFSRKKGPHISASPELVGTLPQAFFFPGKKGPIFLKAPSLWVRCRRRFFFLQEKAPIFLEAPNLGAGS